MFVCITFSLRSCFWGCPPPAVGERCVTLRCVSERHLQVDHLCCLLVRCLKVTVRLRPQLLPHYRWLEITLMVRQMKRGKTGKNNVPVPLVWIENPFAFLSCLLHVPVGNSFQFLYRLSRSRQAILGNFSIFTYVILTLLNLVVTSPRQLPRSKIGQGGDWSES